MKVSAVGQYGLRLTRLGLVNCFLVRERDGRSPGGYTLIDSSLGGSEAAILHAAGDVPILRLLLTHAHVDHVGSVDALMTRPGPQSSPHSSSEPVLQPSIELLASERSIPLLQVPPDLSLRPGEVGHVRGGTPGIRTSVTRTVAEGDHVGSLLVIDTPGHIHGHQAFLDERDGTLYAGDAFGAVGPLTVTGFMPWWFPLKAFSNRDQALDTARKLLDYPVRRVACGHGKVLEGGRALLQAAIDRADARAGR